MSNSNNNVILSVKNLFHSFDNNTNVLNNISFDLYKNETIGIVGESGCGKTTLAKILATIIKASSGTIRFNNINYLEINRKELKELRKSVRMIFQNPETTINPKMSIYSVLLEPLKIYEPHLTSSEKISKIENILKKVRLYEIFDDIKLKNITQLSGGQKRRLSIAKALIVPPQILIADEPTSGLDMSIQKNIIKLFAELPVTKIIISHSLEVISYLCDRIFVMYKGNIIEELNLKEKNITRLKHPFSIELLEAFDNKLFNINLNGKPQNDKGCLFANECKLFNSLEDLEQKMNCIELHPKLESTIDSNHHKIACHIAIKDSN